MADAVSNRWLELRAPREHNLKNIDVRIPLQAPGVRDRRVRLGQVDARRGRAVPGAAASTAASPPRRPAQFAGLARRRAHRRRRDGRPEPDRPHHALQSRELRRRLRRDPRRCSPPSRPRRSASTPPARSASTPATAAARPAAATASSTSRCSSSRTCTCAARTATAAATATRCSRSSREGAERPPRAASPTCSDMTVTEALRLLRRRARSRARACAPLADVGLEYLKLGQPVPTLSGGEAQRLKLAGHLAEAGSVLSSTTHQRQAVPVRRADHRPALRGRREAAARRSASCSVAGHSLLVIEHNLDVIRAADWIIDLGPEGGERGGEIVCAGTPGRRCARTPRSHHRPGARRLRAGTRAAGGGAALAVAEPAPHYGDAPRPRTPWSSTTRASTT